jgi:hypothetical protein
MTVRQNATTLTVVEASPQETIEEEIEQLAQRLHSALARKDEPRVKELLSELGAVELKANDSKDDQSPTL